MAIFSVPCQGSSDLRISNKNKKNVILPPFLPVVGLFPRDFCDQGSEVYLSLQEESHASLLQSSEVPPPVQKLSFSSSGPSTGSANT